MTRPLIAQQWESPEAEDWTSDEDPGIPNERQRRQGHLRVLGIAAAALAISALAYGGGGSWRSAPHAVSPGGALALVGLPAPVLGGCAFPSAAPCMENGRPDADCCALPANASCAAGYEYEALEECWTGGAAVNTCCRKTQPAHCNSSACKGPACIRPAIVIPTYERDLCKVGFLAKSLAIHDPAGILGDVYLAWTSTSDPGVFQGALAELEEEVSRTRRFHLVDFSGQMRGAPPNAGWYMQMVVKLKMAALVDTEYYLIMDSKNAMFTNVHNATFFRSGNTGARIFGYPLANLPGLYQTWYRASAGALGLRLSRKAFYPDSITPAMLHRRTVLDMLQHLGEQADSGTLCDGPLCRLLQDSSATEFTMYYVFASARDDFACIHAPEFLAGANPLGGALWTSLNAGANLYQCQLALKTRPLTFGIQHGAMDGLGDDHTVRDCVLQAYTEAGLYNSSRDNADSFLKCVG